MGYTFVQDLTSDVMYEAEGSTLQELFVHAASALFELTCQVEKVPANKKIPIHVTADNLDHLLQDFLNEIIAQSDIHTMYFSHITITNINEHEVSAELGGADAQIEYGETVAKAVSNYKFGITETDKGYKATVVIDI